MSGTQIHTALRLNLEAAWRHVRADWERSPYEPFYYPIADLVDSDGQGWFDDLKERLRHPGIELAPPLRHPGFVTALNLSFRHPIYLEVEDDLLYAACVDACVPTLLASGLNRWNLCGPVFAADGESGQWPVDLESWFELFELRTRTLLDQGDTYVLLADVSGFFGEIRHDVLEQALLQAGCSSDYVQFLMRMLREWFPSGQGLPWNAASHILGAAYLADVDRELEARGFRFVRMVDDYRVFCRSRIQAERAQDLLREWFSSRGLALNERKSRVSASNRLALYPTSLAARRAASFALVRCIGAAERLGLRSVAKLGRTAAYGVLRTGYRGYLGHVVADLPKVDDLMLALVSGAIPPFYLTFLIPSLLTRDHIKVEKSTLDLLREVALSATAPPPSTPSVARILLFLLAKSGNVQVGWGDMPPDLEAILGLGQASQFRRLEAIIFAGLLPRDVQRTLASEQVSGDYLVSLARKRLCSVPDKP